MSNSSIARSHVEAALSEAAAAKLAPGDCLHALLVTVVQASAESPTRAARWNFR